MLTTGFYLQNFAIGSMIGTLEMDKFQFIEVLSRRLDVEGQRLSLWERCPRQGAERAVRRRNTLSVNCLKSAIDSSPKGGAVGAYAYATAR